MTEIALTRMPRTKPAATITPTMISEQPQVAPLLLQPGLGVGVAAAGDVRGGEAPGPGGGVALRVVFARGRAKAGRAGADSGAASVGSASRSRPLVAGRPFVGHAADSR